MKLNIKIPFLVVSFALLMCTVVMATPFTSSGYVDYNYNGSWNEKTLTGTALYSFYIETPDVSVNRVEIEFESDIFNLSSVDQSDFTVLNPANWSTAISIVDDNYRWSLSSAGELATSVNDPILILFNYQLLGADCYSGASGEGWAWDEGQPWGQAYGLYSTVQFDGQEFIGNRSTGSTAPVPEPTTILLLGIGLVGLGGLGRKKSKMA